MKCNAKFPPKVAMNQPVYYFLFVEIPAATTVGRKMLVS